jgi:hypothetical protein
MGTPGGAKNNSLNFYLGSYNPNKTKKEEKM